MSLWFVTAREGINGGYTVVGGGHLYANVMILYYPPNTPNPPHHDPFPGRRHYRINLKLWGEAGTFKTKGPVLFKLGPLVIFRSDFEHEVVASKRRRVVLSIGIVLPGGRDE